MKAEIEINLELDLIAKFSKGMVTESQPGITTEELLQKTWLFK